jgi:hypothetical protein
MFYISLHHFVSPGGSYVQFSSLSIYSSPLFIYHSACPPPHPHVLSLMHVLSSLIFNSFNCHPCGSPTFPSFSILSFSFLHNLPSSFLSVSFSSNLKTSLFIFLFSYFSLFLSIIHFGTHTTHRD